MRDTVIRWLAHEPLGWRPPHCTCACVAIDVAIAVMCGAAGPKGPQAENVRVLATRMALAFSVGCDSKYVWPQRLSDLPADTRGLPRTDRARGRGLMTALIEDVSCDVTAVLVQVTTLGRTLAKRAGDGLACSNRPGTSNGPTVATNGQLRTPTRIGP